jgi:serine/threonine-protein kinase
MSAAGAQNTLLGQVVLGRYRVLRKLARGGMGTVYLGRTEGAQGFTRPVVIKRILPSLTGDDDTSRMFVREARLLSMLQDPGIVSVIDFGHESGGGLVMVLEYVHGYHLGYFLRYLSKVRGHMPVEMAIHVMVRVLDALHYAHTFKRSDGRELQIIHRDVSPANILLDINGNVKLADFGIARAIGEGDEYHTQTPRLKGKFGYLPPESFRGDDPTVRTDVYACGVVLYELLTGENPFHGKEITDTYHKVLNLVPAPIHSLRADVPKNIGPLLVRALAKEPGERFPSALAFANALRALRTVPDEVSRALLRDEVQKAFAGPLAHELELEPLSVRDAAWREAADTAQSLQLASSAPPKTAETPTRVIDEPIALIETGSEERTKILDSGKAAALIEEIATERRPHVAARSRTPVLVLSALLLAAGAAAAGVLLGRVNHRVGGDRVVVIERQPNAPAQPAPAAAIAVAEPEAPSNAERAPEPATSASGNLAHSAAPIEAALAPDPKLLTRVFARQQARVQLCFSTHGDQLDTRPELSIEFHVSASGAVEQAELTPVTIAKTELGACLSRVARSTRFPKLTEGVAFRIPVTARLVPAR